MSAIVKIPAPLRRFSDGQREVPTSAATVGAALTELTTNYPGLRDRICDADGSLRRFVNIYVRGEDIRFGQGLETQLKDGDDVSIIPAASGGS